MRIGKTAENIFMGVAAVIVGYCSYDVFKDGIKVDKDFINSSSKEIMQKDPKRYARIINDINSEKAKNSVKLWKSELTTMRDSLYIDSIAKTNYAKGAQMVRDSIKNTAKTMK